MSEPASKPAGRSVSSAPPPPSPSSGMADHANQEQLARDAEDALKTIRSRLKLKGWEKEHCPAGDSAVRSSPQIPAPSSDARILAEPVPGRP